MSTPAPSLITLKISSLPPKGGKFTIFALYSLCEIRRESRRCVGQGDHCKCKWSACNVESESFQTIHSSMFSQGCSKMCPTADSTLVQMFYVDSTLICIMKRVGVQLYGQLRTSRLYVFTTFCCSTRLLPI